MLALLVVLTCCDVSSSDFTTTWRTTSANEVIVLPINITLTNSIVNWGDGHSEPATPLVNHTYMVAGLYNVSINGTIKSFSFKNGISNQYASKLIEVLDWGDFEIGASDTAIFSGCANLVRVPATGQPRFLPPNASLFAMFQHAISFNSPLSWNLTNVISLGSAFQNATRFNQPVNFSNTQNVKTMYGMFLDAKSFNQPVIFRADSLTNTNLMFWRATAFNSIVNLTNSFQLSDTTAMFRDAVSFNQPIDFDTGEVVLMNAMFSGASKFDQTLNFDTRKVTSMESMFESGTSFNHPVNFSTSNVTSMRRMFSGAINFNQSVNFDTRNVIYLDSMFENATSFSQPVNFNTIKVTSMEKMFAGATQFNQTVNFTSLANVTDMTSMFAGVPGFDQDFTGWNVSSVVSCSNFCGSCAPPLFTKCQPCSPLYLRRNSYACSCPSNDCSQIIITLNGTENTTFVLTDPSNSSVTVDIFGGLNGTLIGNISLGSNTTLSNSIISLVLQNSTGHLLNVSNLSTPFAITFELKTPMDPNAVSQCVGTQFVFAPVYPTCGFRDPTTSQWETAGCQVASFNSTHVQCNCTHFTLFAVLSPKHNNIVPTAVLDLTPSNVAANPTGLVTVMLLLCLFAAVFVVAALRDRREAAEYEQLRAVKRDKWEKFVADKKKTTFVKLLKIGFQKRHTWFSVVFRKSGTSFRSVDRTFVTLLMVFLSMSVSAFFHAQDNNDIVRALVILITVVVSVVPSQLLALLFVRTGPVGFYEEWEQSRRPQRTNKCLSYRFPERWRVVWRGVTVAVVAGLLIFVLIMSMNFDRQPLYYCRGEAALAWVSTWLAIYAVSVFLIEPLRIILLALATHWADSSRALASVSPSFGSSLQLASSSTLKGTEQGSRGEQDTTTDLPEDTE